MPTEGKGPILIPCYLVDGVPYVLEVDANGKLAVRAAEIETLLGAGLPAALDSLALKVKEQSPLTGFATSAKQDTMITALQLIDDLRAALLLVGTDRLGVRATELETLLAGGLPSALATDALKVREQATITVQAAGGDKIISLESIVEEALYNSDLDAGNTQLLGTVVPTGKIWVITAFTSVYNGTPPTSMYVSAPGLATEIILFFVLTPSSGLFYPIFCNIFLQAGDRMALQIIGATLHDSAGLRYAGYLMDAP